jgi:hypothetical protein
MKILCTLIFFISFSAQAINLNKTWRALKKDFQGVGYHPQIIEDLVSHGLYFTAVPFIKEYLVRKGQGENKRVDMYIDSVISKVGIKQFEVLPESILRRSSSVIVKYILAKKLFRSGRYNDALDELRKINSFNNPVTPFILFLEGSTLSILKKYDQSIRVFNDCVRVSEKEIKNQEVGYRKRQLKINRDNCIVGIARSEFAWRKFDSANLHYLDLEKQSEVWPEILFEEAWNSYYQKDYNRTLGKLVTYKAPVLSFVFNPEIDVLRAVTYLKMCLWGDSRRVVEEFYNTYQNQGNKLDKFLKENRKNYKLFYLMGKNRLNGKIRGGQLLNKILSSTIRDSTFRDLYEAFKTGRRELNTIRGVRNNRLRQILGRNLKDALILQRNLIGAYVKKSLFVASTQVQNALQDMSYIKLEILANRKSSLYRFQDQARKRGDIQYLKRNEKQYFWNFIGEFWADELGDYVFSLKSECAR